jgi:AbrB family looped-hinge helix DNA binding protein
LQTFEATLTEKGQVIIPLEVRRLIGLKPGNKVRFEVEGQIVKISRGASKLLVGHGAVSAREKPEDFQKVREEFEKWVAEEVVSEAEG